MVFECYLKQKLSIDKTLYYLLDQFVKNKPLKTPYHNILDSVVHGKDSIEAIEALLNLQESAVDTNTKQSICLLITYVMRNYSSHNFDDKFHTFNGDEYTKKIFFSCLLSFFIVMQDFYIT